MPPLSYNSPSFLCSSYPSSGTDLCTSPVLTYKMTALSLVLAYSFLRGFFLSVRRQCIRCTCCAIAGTETAYDATRREQKERDRYEREEKRR